MPRSLRFPMVFLLSYLSLQQTRLVWLDALGYGNWVTYHYMRFRGGALVGGDGREHVPFG